MPNDKTPSPSEIALSRLRQATDDIVQETSLTGLYDLAAQHMRRITGSEFVVIQGPSGKIIAQDPRKTISKSLDPLTTLDLVADDSSYGKIIVCGDSCNVEPNTQTTAETLARVIALKVEQLNCRADNTKRDLLFTELNHRIRNTFALVSSVVRQVSNRPETAHDSAHTLEARIAALARAQEISIADEASLRRMLHKELEPYFSTGDDRLSLSGPSIGFAPNAVLPIGLVLHELVTNAAKYGALASSDGQVAVRWTVDATGLNFQWRESGVTIEMQQLRYGFGRSMIENTIPFQFGGTSHLLFDPQGVMFSFCLPPAFLVAVQEDDEIEVAPSQKPATGKKILLVEDNLLLSLDMQLSLKQLGAISVRSAATLEDGLAAAREGGFDLAILDLSLRDDMCLPIADLLLAAQIPYAFVSGYDADVVLPVSHRSAPLLTKPVDKQHLAQVLFQMLSRH